MKIAIILATLLTISFIFHRAAPSGWFFEVFRNFLIQYFIGGAILCAAFLFYREWALAGIMFIVCVSAIYSIRTVKYDPWNISTERELADRELYFRIAQYNKLYLNKNYQSIREWARKTNPRFDMLVIEESQKEDLPLWDSLKEEYPFQFPPPEIIAENEAYILSRYPINAEYRYVHYGEETGKFIRLSVTKDGLPEPISIYVNHTKVPLGERAHASRDMKLNAVSMEIRSDQSQHIIAIGDWNVTPFSPAFHDFVQNSRLRYTYFGVWPLTSWPSFLFLPFLKIPIDHTMSSPNLTLINQIRGPHMYSDHHPLISTFVISR